MPPSSETLVQDFVERLTEEFLKRIERKTDWGKNEVRELFLQSLAVAAISTASDVFQAVSGALDEQKVFNGRQDGL